MQDHIVASMALLSLLKMNPFSVAAIMKAADIRSMSVNCTRNVLQVTDILVCEVCCLRFVRDPVDRRYHTE